MNDMESSSESEDEALIKGSPEEKSEEEEIEDGDATHRLACVNLNWDIVTVFSFLGCECRPQISYQSLNLLHRVVLCIQSPFTPQIMGKNVWLGFICLMMDRRKRKCMALKVIL